MPRYKAVAWATAIVVVPLAFAAAWHIDARPWLALGLVTLANIALVTGLWAMTE